MKVTMKNKLILSDILDQIRVVIIDPLVFHNPKWAEIEHKTT